jgi:hypothetical protein
MTDRSKFEQMLEHLINEDEQKAKELFHDIVVAKSREIYETLISEDFDEGMMPDEMPAEEPEMEASDEFSGDDATDDMMGDIEGGDEEGGDMGGDDVSLSGGDVDELQDRVVDLEDALDALRDEFESLMGGEEGAADDMGGDDMGGDDMGDEPVPEMDGDEMPAMEVRDDDDEDGDDNTDEAFIREYVEKVTAAKGGDDGANTKSIVAKKNDMGGTSGNLNKAFADNGKGGTQGGLLNPSTKDLNSGNVNVPGGKAGVKHLKTVSGGHGAEKKSTGDNGANTNSPINGAPGRAK